MKKIFKSASIILLASLPILSLAQENTEQSFNQSKKQDIQKILETSSNQKGKIFNNSSTGETLKLQSRLDNILKSKENYPKVTEEVNQFRSDIKSTIKKFKSTDGKLSKIKQINVQNVLNKGLFKTLDKKISNLESADLKITEKISSLVADSNLNSSSTTILLQDAEQKLAIARSSVTEVKSQISLAIYSESGISVEAIKLSITESNNKILEAVNSYKLVLDSISKLPNTSETSSSTPTEDSSSTDNEITSDNISTTTNQNTSEQSNTSIQASSGDPQN